jgi:membrane-associated protease RseP (regulator of RpoE activity)
VTEPTRFYAAWHEQELAGTRRVLDGIVAAGHQGPSAELAAFLRQWPGAWYWSDDARTRLVLIRGSAPARPERWLWHGALLILTVITTLAAGAVLAHVWVPPSGGAGLSGAVSGAILFAEFVVGGGWRELLPGWSFAVPLLGILMVHELGHYLAARRYAIDVSPPYFLPVPPNLSPIGNLGAFIRIRSPVYDRRQLLDVGAAGPLAGFVVALVVLWWGYRTSTRLDVMMVDAPSLVAMAGKPIILGESLLTRTLRDWVLPGSGPVVLSPMAFAGWVGMFLTALNLLPLSQLDGGHVLFGLAGKRQAAISLLAVAGLIWLGFEAPMWWVWVALTFVIGRGGWSHPSVVVPDRTIPRTGRIIGVACIIVFILTFVPVPFAG